MLFVQSCAPEKADGLKLLKSEMNEISRSIKVDMWMSWAAGGEHLQ